MDLVLVEEECVLCVLEIVDDRFLSLVLGLRVLLSLREELLQDEEQLVALELLLYPLLQSKRSYFCFLDRAHTRGSSLLLSEQES